MQIGGTNHLNPHNNYHGIKCFEHCHMSVLISLLRQVTNKATILYIHSSKEQNKPSFYVLFIFGLYQHFFSCFVLLLLSSPNNRHYGFGSELFANAIFVM
ncbi:Os06g0647600 [Oryza sativa Japonica Group]|uniref:Os06g0647600 protein n=1 Tax=Oryza sativa subsp. japonica TaxID=39947 RepID=C7J4D0_ORYSJ|nr:Os06g0647600 [Oryza sativa Japonica Group]|eukprot:NP_001174931.1 Os06g0647600 [Oryza sativa Japonica Group]